MNNFFVRLSVKRAESSAVYFTGNPLHESTFLTSLFSKICETQHAFFRKKLLSLKITRLLDRLHQGSADKFNFFTVRPLRDLVEIK